MARQAEREQRSQERQRTFDLALAPVVARLNKAGFAGSSLDEVVAKNAPLNVVAAGILLDELKSLADDRFAEWVIRALAAARGDVDGSTLVHRFDSTCNDNLKWVIVNTIACINPFGIEDWYNRIRGTNWEKTLRALQGPPSLRSK